jgi:GT2 family glycosyltransferase
MTGTAISVIVPTRDRPRQLATCLAALAAQALSAESFDVVVVDDGTATPLDPVLDTWRGRLGLRVLRREGAGPAAARNAGAAAARGAYLAFTDDDCVPASGWLNALLQTLRRRPGAMVGGRTTNLLADSAWAAASQLIVDIAYDYYNPDPENARFFASNNMAVETRAFHDLGGFAPTFRTSEDRDLCDRWRESGRLLVFAPEAAIGHAHQLDFPAFWRQHVGYGRGACRFLRAHRRRTPGSSTLEPRFYTGLVPRAARLARGRPAAASLAGPLTVWQLANTAGFLAECFNQRARQRGRLS